MKMTYDTVEGANHLVAYLREKGIGLRQPLDWGWGYWKEDYWVHICCPLCDKNIRVRQNEKVVRHRPKGAGKGSPLCALGGMQLEDVRKVALVRKEFGDG